MLLDKKKIMFVDDEPSVLEGLENSLYKQRRKWQMHFCNSGKEALEEIENKKFDVIISDMRMPEMDGAMLLEAIKKESPETIRMILSGHSDLQSAMKSVPIAHQF